MSSAARTVGILTRRALNEVIRVPGAAIPGILAPTIFMLGLSAVFGQAAHLRASPPTTSARTSFPWACCRARRSPAPRWA